MKHYATILMALLTLAGCKTTEKNYRAAYERATADKDSDPIDNTIYAAIRREALPSAAITAEGDTLAFKYERVTITSGQEKTPEMLRYNVVAGQFKQAFNARAMASRMRQNGYPDTFIIQTTEPLYYVVTFTTSDARAASAHLRALADDRAITLTAPAPFVVSPRG